MKGHTLYKARQRRLHPTWINLVATQEVTGGVVLGVLLLGEIPGPATLLGVRLTLVGVVAVLAGPSPPPPASRVPGPPVRWGREFSSETGSM